MSRVQKMLKACEKPQAQKILHENRLANQRKLTFGDQQVDATQGSQTGSTEGKSPSHSDTTIIASLNDLIPKELGAEEAPNDTHETETLFDSNPTILDGVCGKSSIGPFLIEQFQGSQTRSAEEKSPSHPDTTIIAELATSHNDLILKELGAEDAPNEMHETEILFNSSPMMLNRGMDNGERVIGVTTIVLEGQEIHNVPIIQVGEEEVLDELYYIHQEGNASAKTADGDGNEATAPTDGDEATEPDDETAGPPERDSTYKGSSKRCSHEEIDQELLASIVSESRDIQLLQLDDGRFDQYNILHDMEAAAAASSDGNETVASKERDKIASPFFMDGHETTGSKELKSPTPGPSPKRPHETIDHRTGPKKKKRRRLSAAEKHPLQPIGCPLNCRRKCSSHVTEDERRQLHTNFWQMVPEDQRKFVLHTCERVRKSDQSQVHYIYKIPIANKQPIQVCKSFFLTTLGFNRKNDSLVQNVLQNTPSNCLTPPEDRRGKHTPPTFIEREPIIKHIESFHPTISHYRRLHAPKVRYLPSDVTITMMFDDFKEKHPEIPLSYELYRRIVAKENIHFTKLGHELCEVCHDHEHHIKACKETDTCEKCAEYEIHKVQYTKARKLYKEHADQAPQPGTVRYSSDMQKVIMLPRMEEFKTAIFTRRLPVYNQTFAPVGSGKGKSLAVIWHAGISGRDKEDVFSAYRQFLTHHRDAKNVILWVDNCSAQNKNWAFFTNMVRLINTDEISADKITVYYFEPGHTFMSCDSLHHQIELSMKHKKFVYDMEDFENSIRESSKKNQVIVKVMGPSDFFRFTDESSTAKRNTDKKTGTKILLTNISSIEVRRSSYILYYKTDLDATEWESIDFLKASIKKTGNFPPSQRREHACGVNENIKKDILAKIVKLMPENRRKFWLNLETEKESPNEDP